MHHSLVCHWAGRRPEAIQKPQTSCQPPSIATALKRLAMTGAPERAWR